MIINLHLSFMTLCSLARQDSDFAIVDLETSIPILRALSLAYCFLQSCRSCSASGAPLFQSRVAPHKDQRGFLDNRRDLLVDDPRKVAI